MIPATIFKDKNVAVLGLGQTGVSAAKSLKAGGAAAVYGIDDNKPRLFKMAEELGLKSESNIPWRDISALIASPGVPNDHPALVEASKQNCPIYSDLDILAMHYPKANFVGITGTNGKSTTTALVSHILKNIRDDIYVAGNIGTPVLNLPSDMPETATIIIEASSFQLDLSQKIAFQFACLLNITADHLDRHGNMENYIAAKAKIFAQQPPPAVAVIGMDGAFSRQVADDIENSQLVPISVLDKLRSGVFAEGGQLFEVIENKAEPVIQLDALERLPGLHNWQNVAAAYAITRHYGLAKEDIIPHILSFKGLEHRQELITTLNGIRYINDSKGTNGDATSRALACYDKVYWILGGKPKSGGIDGLTPWFSRINHAFCIGEGASAFANVLAKHGVPHTLCGTLERAVESAHKTAQAEQVEGSVILLSPACASFDQFTSFEHRGDVFRECVLEHTMQKRQVV